MYKRLDDASKTLLYISGAVSLLFAALGALAAFFLPLGRSAFLLGVLLGYSLTFVKIFLIDSACKKAVEMPAGIGGMYSSAQYAARYLLTGIVLFFALTTERISFAGAVLGLLSLRAACVLAPRKLRAKGGGAYGD